MRALALTELALLRRWQSQHAKMNLNKTMTTRQNSPSRYLKLCEISDESEGDTKAVDVKVVINQRRHQDLVSLKRQSR